MSVSKSSDYKDLIEIAGEFLKMVTGELDPHTKEKGVIKMEGTRAILLTPSHIQFAKYGRGPGKNPPFENILKWVQAENIRFDNSTDRGTAFAIQLSIGKKGTSNWVPGAPNALEEAFDMHSAEYSKKLGQEFLALVNKETRRIYKQVKKKI